MPYGLRKSRGRDLYYVYNKETGHKYSKRPLSREMAERQRRALYASKRRMRGGFSKQIKNAAVNGLIGSALFGRTGAITGAALGAFGNVGFFKGGRRSRRSPRSRSRGSCGY